MKNGCCFYSGACVHARVWHFQYIWEASVTGVCIVPVQRLPTPGSFITQTPVIPVVFVLNTPTFFRGPPDIPSPSLWNPTWTIISFPRQIQELLTATEQSAALIRIPECLFFFLNLCSSSSLSLSALRSKNSKGHLWVFTVEQLNKSWNNSWHFSILSGEIFITFPGNSNSKYRGNISQNQTMKEFWIQMTKKFIKNKQQILYSSFFFYYRL